MLIYTRFLARLVDDDHFTVVTNEYCPTTADEIALYIKRINELQDYDEPIFAYSSRGVGYYDIGGIIIDDNDMSVLTDGILDIFSDAIMTYSAAVAEESDDVNKVYCISELGLASKKELLS